MEVILNAQEVDEARKGMEEGKPAGSGKCTRVRSKGHTGREKLCYIQKQGEEGI